MSTESIETATLGGGCFWCLEAVFQEMQGVLSVRSGYSGGARANPSYEQVSSGATGHAEVVEIVFDPKATSYREVLQVFFSIHDPTTLNRQGADVGSQYRSVIFCHSEAQKEAAEATIRELESAGVFPSPVVTGVVPAAAFYPAEDYHQNYYRDNPGQGYCRMVIDPKVARFRTRFLDKLRNG